MQRSEVEVLMMRLYLSQPRYRKALSPTGQNRYLHSDLRPDLDPVWPPSTPSARYSMAIQST